MAELLFAIFDVLCLCVLINEDQYGFHSRSFYEILMHQNFGEWTFNGGKEISVFIKYISIGEQSLVLE